MPKQIRFEGKEERLLNSVRSMLRDPNTLEWRDAKSTILYCLEFYKSETEEVTIIENEEN